jgi:hypothetical protein
VLHIPALTEFERRVEELQQTRLGYRPNGGTDVAP